MFTNHMFIWNISRKTLWKFRLTKFSVLNGITLLVPKLQKLCWTGSFPKFSENLRIAASVSIIYNKILHKIGTSTEKMLISAKVQLIDLSFYNFLLQYMIHYNTSDGFTVQIFQVKVTFKALKDKSWCFQVDP